MGSGLPDGPRAHGRLRRAAHRLFPPQGLALAAVVLLAAGAARAEGCPAGPVRVTLALSDPAPVLSADTGTAALQAESGLPPTARLHHLGLTASRVEWGSEIDTRWRDVPGGACARPVRIALRLAQTEHRIRLAREIPAGGCLWRAVEAHERRHAALNQATLRQAATAMRRAAEAWAPRAEGRGPDAEAAVARLQAGLRQAMEPALAAMRAAREAGHAAIDSPAEYARLSRLCPEDQAALRRALGVP